MEPSDFLRRLAALVPAPYTNLVRYHGVFAGRSRSRKLLPKPPRRTPGAAEEPAAQIGSNLSRFKDNHPKAASESTVQAASSTPPDEPFFADDFFQTGLPARSPP